MFMHRILKRWGVPALILLMLMTAACSTSTRTRRTIKKKCDCRKWSYMIHPHTQQVASDPVAPMNNPEYPVAYD
jgi:hypothetical protein